MISTDEQMRPVESEEAPVFSQNPLFLLARAVGLSVRRRLHFESDPSCHTLESHGEEFVAFRKLVVTPSRGAPGTPGAVFRVQFRFKNLSSAVNRALSWIPVPLIAAQPGFRSKTWYIGRDSGDFIGDYEFDTLETAEAYWTSLPLRMMRRRAAPGSLTKSIYSK